MDTACRTYGKMIRMLIGKAEGKKRFVRLKSRWEDNIKTGLKEIGREIVDWIQLTQHRAQ
jgi:hypothetical protein